MGNIVATVARNIAHHRALKQLSLAALAKRAGIAKATLVAVECGSTNPTLGTLQSICDALQIPLAEILVPVSGPRVDVKRLHDAVWQDTYGLAKRRLSTYYKPEVVYVFEGRVSRRGSRANGHEPGSIESVYVISGKVVAGPEREPVELGPGDWLRFEAEEPHICKSVTEESRVIYVATRRLIPEAEASIKCLE